MCLYVIYVRYLSLWTLFSNRSMLSVQIRYTNPLSTKLTFESFTNRPNKLLILHLQAVFFFRSPIFTSRERVSGCLLLPRIQMLHSRFIIWRMGCFMLRCEKQSYESLAIYRPNWIGKLLSSSTA